VGRQEVVGEVVADLARLPGGLRAKALPEVAAALSASPDRRASSRVFSIKSRPQETQSWSLLLAGGGGVQQSTR
jgi:hypothetical protein